MGQWVSHRRTVRVGSAGSCFVAVAVWRIEARVAEWGIEGLELCTTAEQEAVAGKPAGAVAECTAELVVALCTVDQEEGYTGVAEGERCKEVGVAELWKAHIWAVGAERLVLKGTSR